MDPKKCGVVDPIAQGSVLAVDDAVLFSGPTAPDDQVNVTVWLSLDAGETIADSILLRKGTSGYSDMTVYCHHIAIGEKPEACVVAVVYASCESIQASITMQFLKLKLGDAHTARTDATFGNTFPRPAIPQYQTVSRKLVLEKPVPEISLVHDPVAVFSCGTDGTCTVPNLLEHMY